MLALSLKTLTSFLRWVSSEDSSFWLNSPMKVPFFMNQSRRLCKLEVKRINVAFKKEFFHLAENNLRQSHQFQQFQTRASSAMKLHPSFIVDLSSQNELKQMSKHKLFKYMEIFWNKLWISSLWSSSVHDMVWQLRKTASPEGTMPVLYV